MSQKTLNPNEFLWYAMTRKVFQWAFPFLDIEVGNAGATEGLQAAVLAMKHQHMFDIPAAILAVTRQIRFMAKSGLFRFPGAKMYFRKTGTISVPRPKDKRKGKKKRVSPEKAEKARAAARTALNVMVETAIVVLMTGGILGIFAEGTRILGDVVGKLEKGLLTFIEKAEAACEGLHIPVVPVGIHYGKRYWWLLPIWTVDIYVGAAFCLLSYSDEALQLVKEQMQDAQDHAVAQAKARGVLHLLFKNPE